MDFHVYRNKKKKKVCLGVCMLRAVQQEKKKKSEPLTDRIDLES